MKIIIIDIALIVIVPPYPYRDLNVKNLTVNIRILIIGLIMVSFLMGVYLHPYMPEKIASHWDASGNVDDYISKLWSLFLMPTISTILFLVFILTPKIDPLKRNVEKFRGYFDVFMLLLFGFPFYLYMLTMLWRVMTENAKQNRFIGVKTPWK